MNTQPAVLLAPEEFERRIKAVRRELAPTGADAALITDNANIYYLTGRVLAGYIYLPAEGSPLIFVRRPVGLEGQGVVHIRKPEQMPDHIAAKPRLLAIETDTLSVSFARRLTGALADPATTDASAALSRARAVKTPAELALIEMSGRKQEAVYRRVPRLYRDGMTDLELQVEIERACRLEGCLGLFRISGSSMEIYMGNILTADNADTPTPYDFAMGGEGLDPSLPVGANGTLIRPGQAVMVDINGNYTGYMTDMTRTFRLGPLPEEALRAHRCSIDICRALEEAGKPGVEASALYELAASMARDAGLESYFMGHAQKAGFVGHGVGIEINELPVLAPRSRQRLQEGNVIAIEPKFVMPRVGAVGIENTYVVTPSGLRCLTNAPEDIIEFAQ